MYVEILLDNFDNIELRKYLSLENEVNEDAPDLFLWTTLTDESVHPMNSLLLVEAYKKHNKNVEFHMFPMGGHGLSTANLDFAEGDISKVYPYISKWITLADEWIKNKCK